MSTMPTRFCDLVMKGGITSGVVYPLAVCELSKEFQFKNIGGTSAGAIAAAAAAAAEYGRQNHGRAFILLEQLPKFVGETPAGADRTNLFGFFQPQLDTAPIFNTAIAGLGGGKWAWLRILVAGCRNFWLQTLLGMLPGSLVIWFAWTNCHGLSTFFIAVLGLMTILLGVVLAVVVGLLLSSLKQIPANFFGLCTGMPGVGCSKTVSLTIWLKRYLNALAGLKEEGRPLTFGDLQTVGVNLEMITTCLSHGRPYRLPFRDDEMVKENKQFFYRPEDFARLFPPCVMEWLAGHQREPSEDKDTAAREGLFLQKGFVPLPKPEDLPVVMAVRMSLSFPILLSAVPLYAVDYSRKEDTEKWPRRCWFSDGGISSNFPIHFFDTALPRWPTFGIDLSEKHPDYNAGFYMPKRNSDGILVKWKYFDQGSNLQRLLGFLAGIIFTAKDWADNAQCRLPGFRDRIAQVSLTDLDGGLNLNMPTDRIERLSNYGRQAGKEFVNRFAGTPPSGCNLDWSNHRQIRLRTTLAAIEEWLLKLNQGCKLSQPGDQPYPSLIGQPAPSYPWKATQVNSATSLLQQLLTAAQSLESVATKNSNDILQKGAPRPFPELRVRPRI